MVNKYLKILAEYYEKIYPLQYVAHILSFLVLVLAFRKSILSSRINSAIFAMLWLWVAAVFALPYAIDGMTNAIILCFFHPGWIFSTLDFDAKITFWNILENLYNCWHTFRLGSNGWLSHHRVNCWPHLSRVFPIWPCTLSTNSLYPGHLYVPKQEDSKTFINPAVSFQSDRNSAGDPGTL